MGLVPEHGLGVESPRGRTFSFDAVRRAVTPLNVYLAIVLAAGAVALSFDASSVSLPSMNGRQAIVTAVLAIAVIVGELLPMKLRRGYKVETYTLSGTATIALILTGPLWVATLVQISAGIVDDIRSRRSLLKVGFNASQYAIGLTASRAVFALLSGQSITGFTPNFTSKDLAPALVAAFTFFFVNVCIVAMVNAVADGRPPSATSGPTSGASSRSL